MPLATKNNAIIVKDGKVADGCGCCARYACFQCISCLSGNVPSTINAQVAFSLGEMFRPRQVSLNVTLTGGASNPDTGLCASYESPASSVTVETFVNQFGGYWTPITFTARYLLSFWASWYTMDVVYPNTVNIVKFCASNRMTWSLRSSNFGYLQGSFLSAIAEAYTFPGPELTETPSGLCYSNCPPVSAPLVFFGTGMQGSATISVVSVA